ncbi:dihydroorotate dehydrogenase [Candidatus Roizmanbacteria bacterium CG_4_9_14_0_2_um_filter_39_13]|uniref:Dihydroorotate dehydrogenase n=2 Tax=Candidatus Roizmaniibacteriota TaxID=1752723 RepID=A0A2M8EW32_9BACT|nr:MAG: dihydroorotate dehydrogenase [Candidatus Roizmanbacteria bacterium CG_4_9_14_0_2_um_filter_39_13]PJE62229.1 MAG: dihydroorotate dehydrogenase [Candidatus Roizmanbacteria bacterium CG10_big_fil_rev_8_21_14_0_10_39_12]
MIDLSVNLAGIQLKNPTILASGIMGVSASSLKFVEENGAGAVTIKSIGHNERFGHHNPTVYAWEKGIHNAVGLSNPGIDGSKDKIQKSIKILKIPFIGSMFADTISNFVMVAEKMAVLKPAIIELNLSCPNTADDLGRMYASDVKMTYDVISSVKKVVGNIPLFAKLTADVTDITEIGKSAESAGADGLTAINTVSGINIDTKLKRPILTNKVGGLSGPAIRPIGVRAVYNLYKAVKIPIIGTGGINTGEDAIEFIMAGATAVGIGSGIYYRGIDIFKKVTTEIEEFMKKEGYNSIEEMRGVAHKN